MIIDILRQSNIYNGLRNSKIYYIFDFIRNIPNIIKFIKKGFAGPMPPPLKRIVIKQYLENYKLSIFIETGTLMGDTTIVVARTGAICYTIELSEKYYNLSKKKLKKFKNVHIFHGNSRDILPNILTNLNQPALFYLDAHFSGNDTANSQNPIYDELNFILSHKINKHVILIDDARLFNGTDSYPEIEQIYNLINKHFKNLYSVEISCDIIRIVPL